MDTDCAQYEWRRCFRWVDYSRRTTHIQCTIVISADTLTVCFYVHRRSRLFLLWWTWSPHHRLSQTRGNTEQTGTEHRSQGLPGVGRCRLVEQHGKQSRLCWQKPEIDLEGQGSGLLHQRGMYEVETGCEKLFLDSFVSQRLSCYFHPSTDITDICRPIFIKFFCISLGQCNFCVYCVSAKSRILFR